MSSRASDHAFININTDGVVSELTTSYESITGKSVVPGSPDSLFISWVSAVIGQQRAIINYVANQNLPSRAEGENLDALADLFYASERPGATAAVTTVRFYLSEVQEFAVLVAKGTRVTDSETTMYWRTDEDVYIDAGDEYADIVCTCEEKGTAGNGYGPGTINRIVDVFEYYTECENTTTSSGGADKASDDEFYEYMKASQHAYSTAGSRGAYEYWAKTVSNAISDVKAVRTQPGYVKIYTMMDDGNIATTDIKNAVLAACSADTVRPLSDYVSVGDPTQVTYNVTVTYYLGRNSDLSATEIEEAVSEAVSRYNSWQTTVMGRDINPSRLIQLLMEAGVKRCVVTAPVFTELNDGTDGNAPQVAKLGSVSVTSGGYEYE